MAGSRRRRGRVGWRRTRSARALRELDDGRAAGAGARAQAGWRAQAAGARPIRSCSTTCASSSTRRLSRRPEQPLLWTAKSVRKLAASLRSAATRSATDAVAGCCASSATACSPTRRRGGQAASRSRRPVPAHQRNGRCGDRRRPAGDLDRHQEEGAGRRLQERRPRVAPEGQRAERSAPTTSRAWPRARRSPTASMTSPTTAASSTSGSTATPPSSRSPRSGPGGNSWAKPPTPTPSA